MRKRFGSVQLDQQTRLSAHGYTQIFREPSGAIVESLVTAQFFVHVAHMDCRPT